MTQFLERLYGRLIINIHRNQCITGSLLQVRIITTSESKQRYFIYCPESEIFIASIFPFQEGLQVNFHPNTSDYIWSDRICDYIDGIAKSDTKDLVVGYEIRRFPINEFPHIRTTLDKLIQLSKTSPELGDACSSVWERNCFADHIPYRFGYDSLFQ